MVCIESTLGFPFYPKYKALLSLNRVYKKTKYSDPGKKYLDYVRSELGDDPKNQTKVYFTGELIKKSSREFCGIGRLSVNTRLRELKLEDNDEYPIGRLQPNRVFSNECPEYNDSHSQGCLASESYDGRKKDVCYFLTLFTSKILSFFLDY